MRKLEVVERGACFASKPYHRHHSKEVSSSVSSTSMCIIIVKKNHNSQIVLVRALKHVCLCAVRDDCVGILICRNSRVFTGE